MNEKLNKSPLTYVLMQVKISQVLNIAEFIPTLQAAIRKGFPLYKALDFRAIELKPGNNQPEFQSYMQWHFGDKESTTGILISRDAITIHTSKYESFEQLCDSFSEILFIFKNFIDVSLYTRVGIRYNNLIHDHITKYINTHLQGFHITNKQGFVNNYFSRTESIQQTQCGGNINIRSAHFSDKNTFKLEEPIYNIFVTPELWQCAGQLSFNHHNENKMPKKDFIVLDIDHFINRQGDFESKDIINIFKELHEDVYTAFRGAVTEEAINAWR